MSETTPTNAVYEKPKAVWVAGAWLSTVAAVMGVGLLTNSVPLYGGVFAMLVSAWVVYGAGWPPGGQRLLALGALIAWGVSIGVWLDLAGDAARRLLNRGAVPASAFQDAIVIEMVAVWVLCIVSGTLVGLATRSKRVSVSCVLVSFLMLGLLTGSQTAGWIVATCWHYVVFGSVVLWGVRARTRRLSGSHCAGCGYDLAGIEGPVCPECGRARVMAAAPAPKASPPPAATSRSASCAAPD